MANGLWDPVLSLSADGRADGRGRTSGETTRNRGVDFLLDFRASCHVMHLRPCPGRIARVNAKCLVNM